MGGEPWGWFFRKPWGGEPWGGYLGNLGGEPWGGEPWGGSLAGGLGDVTPMWNGGGLGEHLGSPLGRLPTPRQYAEQGVWGIYPPFFFTFSFYYVRYFRFRRRRVHCFSFYYCFPLRWGNKWFPLTPSFSWFVYVW